MDWPVYTTASMVQGANVISLRSVLKPYEAAIVTDCSHLVADECGAPETAGIKLLQVPPAQR